MKKVNIIYSLNTHPIIHNRWHMGNKFEDTIYMTATSILLSSLWYDTIKLYVDPVGFPYLSELPCEVIKLDFDNHQELWMESKLYAMKNEQNPFVHLDTDVFIKKPIEFVFDKVIVERKDVAYYYYNNLISFFDPYFEDLAFWNPEIKFAWSCGIIGFNDMELKNEFLQCYNTLKTILNENRLEYESFKKGHKGYLEVALLLEQYNLTSLLSHLDINPNVLIPGDSIQAQSQYANEIGYTHLLGASKYHPKNVNKMKMVLKTKFLSHYEHIKTKFEKCEGIGVDAIMKV